MSKLAKRAILKWVSISLTEKSCSPSKSCLYHLRGPYYSLRHSRFCGTERAAVNSKNGGNPGELAMKSRLVIREAQSVLLDYLHSTRNFQFVDAENMSKNAPEFVDRLLKRIDVDDSDVGRSLARFLRYHPINEFEPFFESIGLNQSEYVQFLPRDLMFLNDDHLLLENYYVLCNYGISRNNIGKIYKEATEVFSYGYGVLQSKLQSFQTLGLNQSFVVKIIASSPYLLRGSLNEKFLEPLQKLKNAGIGYDWLENHISEAGSYNWKYMPEILCLLNELGLSDEQLRELIVKHPDLLLESSELAIYLFGFLLKFGCVRNEVKTIFLQFPQLTVVKFTNNLYHCYKFLSDIGMKPQDIGVMVRSRTHLLGSCELKSLTSLMSVLNCGKFRLCQMVKENPDLLKEWVMGIKVKKLPNVNRVQNARQIKKEFLLNIGFADNSKEMEKALKTFRGRGMELQERFDHLLKIGLSREEVIGMLKVSPQVLNQSKDTLAAKINFFVQELGYSVSDLLSHPPLASYTIQRVKLRLLTYKWLKDEGVVHPKLALSTLMSCSDRVFLSMYVNRHPRGFEFWSALKKELYSE